MLKGLRDFDNRGKLIEVAVGLIMALATFVLVQALVADLITPIIAAIVGEPSFEDLTFTINESEFATGTSSTQRSPSSRSPPRSTSSWSCQIRHTSAAGA